MSDIFPQNQHDHHRLSRILHNSYWLHLFLYTNVLCYEGASQCSSVDYMSAFSYRIQQFVRVDEVAFFWHLGNPILKFYPNIDRTDTSCDYFEQDQQRIIPVRTKQSLRYLLRLSYIASTMVQMEFECLSCFGYNHMEDRIKPYR